MAKYQAALRSLDSAARHRTLGLALAVNGGGELAEAAFSRALQVDPRDAESRYQRALLMGARGDLDGQIKELRRTIQDDPAFYAGTYALGCALLDRGDLDEAEKAFRTLQAKQGPTFMGQLGLGLLALEKDRPDEAIPFLRQTAQKYPQDLFVRFQLGQAHLALGQEALAQELLTGIEDAGGRPVLRSPGAAEAEAYRINRAAELKSANEMMRRSEFGRALPIFEKHFARDQADTAAGNNLAIAYMGLGQLEKSLEVIERCIELDPDLYGAWVTRANTLLQIAERERAAGEIPASKVELERALESSGKAIQLAPRVDKVQLVHGQILAALRRDAEAIQAFEEALALGATEESTYLSMLAPVRREQGVAALETLMRDGLKEPGARPRLRFELCGVLVKAGRGQEARALQEELAQLAPGHPLTQQADQLLRRNGL